MLCPLLIMFYPRLKVHDDSMGFSLANAGGLSKGLVCRGGVDFSKGVWRGVVKNRCFVGFWAENGVLAKNKQKMREWLAGRNRRGIMGAKRLLWKDIEK